MIIAMRYRYLGGYFQQAQAHASHATNPRFTNPSLTLYAPRFTLHYSVNRIEVGGASVVFDFISVYQTYFDLFNVINHTTKDFFTITDISASHFPDVGRDRDKRRCKFRFRRYKSDSQILFITIPTHLHEALQSK
ncbi:hypothetical protein B0J18DRAFT_457388 [Chaetomium sp. MPI-SDFR-AT-0129]|nr:hypothetical protein B0J18DRAFT_457388 [Chaetomium sp. MPI-SDFR-AT-0129]